MLINISGSEAAGAKVRGREGKNPDQQLRSLILVSWTNEVQFYNSQDVGLEAAIHLKSA